MKKLRWGLLSTARINRAVIPPIRASLQSELKAVASRDVVKAKDYAREWHIPHAYGSYEELLADENIDVIYNPLPNHLHAEWSIRAAEAGKHVLCEKPLALSLDEVDQMMAAAKKHNVIITEAFMYKHHPQTLKVLDLIKQDAIGDLLLIKGAFTFNLDRPDDVRWVPEWGGGSIWDVGCYPISFCAPRRKRGSGGGVWLAGDRLDRHRRGLQRPDCALPAACWRSSIAASGHRIRTAMEIVGTKGSIELGSPFKPAGGEWIKIKRGDSVDQLRSPEYELYRGEIDDMEQAVLGGQAPRISLENSRGNVATILALLESAQTGQVVRL